MAFDLVQGLIDKRGLKLAAPVIHNPTTENSVYIPLYSAKVAGGTRVPSQKTLSELKQELLVHRIYAIFLMIDPSSQMLEEGLRSSLLGSYPDLVRNSFLNVEAGSHHVWIDTKSDPGGNATAIKESVSTYLRLFDVSRVETHFMGDAQLASNTEILSIIRRKAPIGCNELKAELEHRSFPVPSLDWINRKFDTLRRSGLLVRRQDRTYALTADALHRLGTRKDRFSPDIGRLLDLARRDA